jgi:hypothetical protein
MYMAGCGTSARDKIAAGTTSLDIPVETAPAHAGSRDFSARGPLLLLDRSRQNRSFFGAA